MLKLKLFTLQKILKLKLTLKLRHKLIYVSEFKHEFKNLCKSGPWTLTKANHFIHPQASTKPLTTTQVCQHMRLLLTMLMRQLIKFRGLCSKYTTNII